MISKLDITNCDFQCGQDGIQARANMNNYNSLLQSMSALAEKMQGLNALAVAQHTPVVETIISTRCRDAQNIERTLDGMLDFCGYDPALQLYRRLCRYYWDIDPAATASYVDAYRMTWDSEENKIMDSNQLTTANFPLKDGYEHN